MDSYKMNTYDMKTQLQRGKIGEEIIYWWLYNQDFYIEDVRNEPGYQKEDVDFIIVESGEQAKIEVKTDFYTTGNIFVELESTWGKTRGCLLKTKSDYILYFFIKENKLFIIDTKEFQDYIVENKDRFPKKVVRNKGYDTLGITIPYRVLQEELPPTVFREVSVFALD